MTAHPYVLLSAAMSIDGYLDDSSGARLMLSNEADLDRVDQVRAGVDAILVGAATIRRDNPRLLIRSTDRQQQRIRRGVNGHPMKVTLTGSGDLDVAARFFTCGDSEKLVYVRDPAVPASRGALGNVATVVAAGDPIDLVAMLDDLGKRKVERLMVEGGGTVHTQFLSAGLVDEIQVVIAPFFIGDPAAPRFVQPGRFPQDAHRPL
ncbi:MAG: dihydrofolate reductase family protein, partial [Pseudonocardiales bacterium]|nr:dihydrofolate reductase family protein [Pseudonocardiales bacterium]